MYVDSSHPTQEGQAQLPTPEVWAAHSDFLPERTGCGVRGNFTVTKPDKPHLSRMITVKMGNHVDSMCPWYDALRRALYICDLLPLNPQPDSNHEKKLNHSNRGTHRSTPDSARLKAAQVLDNEKNPRQCHSPEEPMETWQLHVMWYPEQDPGTMDIWIKNRP